MLPTYEGIGPTDVKITHFAPMGSILTLRTLNKVNGVGDLKDLGHFMTLKMHFVHTLGSV